MIEILDARYGPDGSEKDLKDVTEKVRSRISSDGTSVAFNVSPSNLGLIDPSPGNPKILAVRYSVNGQETSERILDGNTLAVSLPIDPIEGPFGLLATLHGLLWKNALTALITFLYVASISLGYELGSLIGGGGAWAIIPILFPYGTYYITASGIILLRAFAGVNFITK